jgi:GDP-4-dehydro-6-deoxy-D-mannose reductase
MVRPFNHAGPRQSDSYVLSSLARQVAEVEIGQKARVEVGNLEVVRDFTDVRDIVRAYRLLAYNSHAGEIYNLGTNRDIRLSQMLGILQSFARKQVNVYQDPSRMRAVDQPRLLADASKLRDATGWQPQFAIEQTLKDMLESWRDALAKMQVTR